MRKRYTTSGDVPLAIVLGKYLLDDGTPSCELKERLERARELYESGAVRKLLLTGGLANKNSPLTEAEAMKIYLLGKGVREEDVILETRSLTTFQNAKFCADIVYNEAFSKIYLVSSARHIYRAYFNPVSFFKRKFGMPVVPTAAWDLNVEVFGEGENILVYYKNRGKLAEFIKNHSDCRVIAKRKYGIIRQGFFPKNVGSGKNETAAILEDNLRKIFGEMTVEYI